MQFYSLMTPIPHVRFEKDDKECSTADYHKFKENPLFDSLLLKTSYNARYYFNE